MTIAKKKKDWKNSPSCCSDSLQQLWCVDGHADHSLLFTYQCHHTSEEQVDQQFGSKGVVQVAGQVGNHGQRKRPLKSRGSTGEWEGGTWGYTITGNQKRGKETNKKLNKQKVGWRPNRKSRPTQKPSKITWINRRMRRWNVRKHNRQSGEGQGNSNNNNNNKRRLQV